MINKIIAIFLPLSFLPFRIPLPFIGIRIFDILALLFLFSFLRIKVFTIPRHRYIGMLLLLFLASILSSFGLIFFTPENILISDFSFHLNNIFMGSIRYLEIVIIFIIFLKYYNSINLNSLIKYIFIAIVINDFISFYLYIDRLVDSHENILQFIVTGRFIHNFRFFESVGSVNGSAGFLLMTIPIILYYKKHIVNKLFYYFIILFHIFLMFLTGSKLIFIGLILLSIILVIFKKRRSVLKFMKYFIIIIISSTLFYSSAPPSIKYRIDGLFNQDKSTSERIVRANISLNILQDSPLFGYGYSSTYKYLFEKYAEGEARNWIRGVGAHNSYVTLFVQLGIIGVFTFTLFIILLLIDIFSSLMKRREDFEHYIAISIFIMIIASTTDDILMVPVNNFVFFFLISVYYFLNFRRQRLA